MTDRAPGSVSLPGADRLVGTLLQDSPKAA